jgi:hypothetical protein
MTRPKTVHHFTSHAWLPFIQEEGIYRGKCPVTSKRVLDHPNFTTDPDPAHQGWAGGASINKTAIRITVKVRRGDTDWIPWVELARQNGINPDFMRRLNENGGGGMRHWWIHRGIIRPSDFLAAEVVGEPTPADLLILRLAEEWGSRTHADYERREIEEGYSERVIDHRLGPDSTRLITVPTVKFLDRLLGTTA